MPLSEQFPTDPYAILDPAIRWYPGDELVADRDARETNPATR